MRKISCTVCFIMTWIPPVLLDSSSLDCVIVCWYAHKECWNSQKVRGVESNDGILIIGIAQGPAGSLHAVGGARRRSLREGFQWELAMAGSMPNVRQLFLTVAMLF